MGFFLGVFFMELVNWKFLKPIFIGDTIKLETRIASKRQTSKPQWGIVQTERTLINQRDERVQTGFSNVMVWTRNGGDPS